MERDTGFRRSELRASGLKIKGIGYKFIVEACGLTVHGFVFRI